MGLTAPDRYPEIFADERNCYTRKQESNRRARNQARRALHRRRRRMIPQSVPTPLPLYSSTAPTLSQPSQRRFWSHLYHTPWPNFNHFPLALVDCHF
jgi:hypothetical protein